MADEQVIETAAPDAKPAESSTAPIETPEAKTPEQLAAEQQAADEAKKAEDDEKAEEERIKRKPWFQKRIDEITKQKHEEARLREAERTRADRMERLLEQAMRQQQPKPPDTPAPPPQFTPTRPAPTREQFDFDEDKFIAAAVDWKFEQIEAQRTQAARAAEMRKGQEAFANEVEGKRQATLQEGAKKYPDFDAVVGAIPSTVMNPELALAVLETASPSDIAYHLGKNPAEAERISKLPPIRKAIELGKLEATLAAATKPTTKAPPPPSPVGGREPATTDTDKLPMDEWYRLRQAGKIR